MSYRTESKQTSELELNRKITTDELFREEEASNVILVSAGYDQTIKFWKAHTGECMRTIHNEKQNEKQNDGQINCIQLNDDGQLLAVGGYQTIKIYDATASTSTGPLVCCTGMQKNILQVGFDNDGRWMYSCGEDGSIRIWDFRSSNGKGLQCAKSIQFQDAGAINSAVLHPNQTRFYVGSQNGQIHTWSLLNNAYENFALLDESSVQDLSIDPFGINLAAVNNLGEIKIWPLTKKNNEEIRPFMYLKAHEKYALKCYYSNNSKYLATTSADGTCKIWNSSNLTPISNNYGDLISTRWVWDCAFTYDDSYLFTASSDNLIRLWSLETGKIVKKYVGHQKAVTCLAFRDVE